MDTQGMTPEEKAVVMQFMGQTYGQLHKQDQGIIGTSGNLRPKSQQMKEVFEQTAHIPVIQKVPQAPPPQPQAAPPQPVQQITPEQAAAELQQAPPAIEPVKQLNNESVHNPNQMELDLSEPTVTDKLLDLLKEQNLLFQK